MKLVAALGVALAVGQAQPAAVTVAAPDKTATISVAKLRHWTRAERSQERALTFLISSAWYQGEARERGIAFTSQQVRDELEIQIRQSFRARADYRRYLRENHLTRADVLLKVRIDMVQTAIREQITQSVTPEQVDAYVQAHPQTEPEQRDLRIVLTKTRNAAQRARAELQRGRAWKGVAKRYSIDDSSRGHGGLVPNVIEGTMTEPADRAAFNAREGVLIGPIRTQFGFYVMEVIRITPAHPEPIDEQRARARETLIGQAQDAAVKAFLTDFRQKWKARTDCAASYASHPYCHT